MASISDKKMLGTRKCVLGGSCQEW